MTRNLGLDLGGTNIKLVVLEDERVVEQDTTQTLSEEGPDAVLARVAEAGRGVGRVDTIGVGLPGLSDEQGRALLFPNLHGDWAGRPIREPLERALRQPVALVNDGHAFALAEARIGAARGARDVICFVLGTGIGGGLVIDGRLHLGVADRAGEVGHHTVLVDGPRCNCGNRGCLELVAGSRAIAEAAGKATFEEVVAAARAGEPRSRDALDRAGTFVGIAVANLTIYLAPERVVIGGGVAEAGELLLEPIRAEVRRRAGNVAPLERIEIVPAELGHLAGAIGAALFGLTSRGGRDSIA